MLNLICPEFDEFEEALDFVQGRYLLHERTVRDWRLHAVELGDVEVMIAQEGAANVYHGACVGSFLLVVPLTGHDLMTLNGQQIARQSIAWLAPGDEFAFRADGTTHWAGVSIAGGRVLRWLELHEVDAAPLLRSLVVPSDAAMIEKLLHLIRRVLRIEERSPETLNASPACELARQELVDVALSAVVARSAEATQRRLRPHLRKQKILKHASQLIETSIDQPIGLDDLCRAANTSRRTLHAVFAEHLGMSPHQYLIRRRLHAIHMGLRKAEPSQTVTEICAQFGVWDVGRFAQRYRRQFGRLPSEVLATTRQAG